MKTKINIVATFLVYLVLINLFNNTIRLFFGLDFWPPFDALFLLMRASVSMYLAFIHTLDFYGLHKRMLRKNPCLFGHDYDTVATENTACAYKCNRCGKIKIIYYD